MNVKDPGTLLVAWVIAPLLVALASAAIGEAVGAACSLRLGYLTVPTGFFAGIVVMTAALRVGVTGRGAVAAALVCVVVGAVVAVRERRRTRADRPREPGGRPWVWPTLAGTAAYALALAPLVGSGRSGILGYVLNNDPSVHIVMIDWLRDHGAAAIANPDSSYTAAANLASSGYPLGGHVWLIFAGLVTGTDTFHLWTPFMATAGGILAFAAFALVRSIGLTPPIAAAAAVLVASGYLPYSFQAESGFKEIAMAASVLTFAALFERAVDAGLTVRRSIPALLTAAGAAATFSLAAAAWLGPAVAIAALWLVRAVIRGRRAGRGRIFASPSRVAVAVAALIAAAVPVLITAWRFLDANRADFESPLQVGNLLAPVPFGEAFNIWFGHDYRYPTPVEPDLTTAAIVATAILAGIGCLAILWRRRPAPLLALLSGAAGTGAIVLTSESIYYEVKSYVVIAPVLGLATVAGLVWLHRRPRLSPVAVVLAAALAVGVLASDALVYAGAWVTPKERLGGLVEAGRRVPGDGPVLINDREYYAKYLLRRLRPWNSWEEWQPFRGFRWGEIPPPPPRSPDLDDYKDDLMARFPAIIERRRPGGSRPPGNYSKAFENRWYQVWLRTSRPPRVHLPLGIGSLSGSARLDCGARAARELLRAARGRGRTLRIAPARPRPKVAPTFNWGGTEVLEPGPARNFVKLRGGQGYAYARLRPGVRYRVWIQGAYGPGVRVTVGRRQLGEVRSDQEQFSGWHLVGEFVNSRRGAEAAVTGLDRPWLLAGSAWKDLTGPLAFERSDSEPQLRTIPATAAASLCGKRLDWVELI